MIPAPAWQPDKHYPAGMLVRHKGTLLRCQETHHAGSWSDPWGSLRAPRLATLWRVDTPLMRHEAGICDETCRVVKCVKRREGKDAA